MTAPLSDVMEDYLKTIYHLERDGGADTETGDGDDSGRRVATSAIADRLGVEPSTVTSALDTLADRGFVDREKYEGVRLTEEGRTVALEVLRHHRLLETFLLEHLDYDWSEVHDEADRLEHHISEEFERRVAETLDDPRVDPHGDPIPGADLAEPDDDTVPLGAFEAGDAVVVERVSDRSDEELDYLADAGVVPGTTLEIVDVAPFGMLTVRVARDDGDGSDGEAEQSLPEEVAAAIRVRGLDETVEAGIDEG
mgnify:CR=1 FL=1